MERWLGVLAHEAEIARDARELPAGTDPEQLAFELNAALMGANWAHRLLHEDVAFQRAQAAIDRLLGP
jgi:hypothetical protein